ncbi:MAG: family 78 glycoside hydrolase catalytic domain [Phycisphaeraceae bacterium JB051]
MDTVPNAVILKIAAESVYRLWINGKLVCFGPARGTRSCNFYDCVDIARYLQQGKNVIAVLVQCMNIPTFIAFPHQPGLWVELENILTTDANWQVLNNDEWQEDVEIYTLQVGFMEHRDLRCEPIGWQTCEDSATWEKATILGNADAMNYKRLLPRPIPMLKQTTHLPEYIPSAGYVTNNPTVDPKEIALTISYQQYTHVPSLKNDCQSQLTTGEDITIAPSPDGQDVAIVFDFADEFIGYAQLELTCQSGVIVDFAHDEALDAGWVKAARHHYRTADRYITRNGRQTLGNTINDRGFRYVMIVLRHLTEPVVLHRMAVNDCRYPYEPLGTFSCNVQQLNRIWEVCTNTLSICTTDTFLDCPWRERSFWVNDLVVENLVSLQAFGDPRINAHCLRLAMGNAREDGWIPGVCPDTGEDNLVLVPTNLMLVIMLADYYQYTGDKRLVNELLPRMLDVLHLFESHINDKGLIVAPETFWNFLDWSYELNGSSLNGKCTSLLSWLYCYALNTAGKLAGITPFASQASELSEQAREVARRIDASFWDDDKLCYADWLDDHGNPSEASSQLTHALALLSGSIPEHRKQQSIDALDRVDLLEPELYLHHFVFQAMQQAGKTDAIYQRVQKHWGAMVQTGTTTLWEAFVHRQGKEAYDDAGSLCHGFAACPINYFQTGILGITPTKPGFETFEIQPIPHGLSHASGTIPTPHGLIHMSWERLNEQALKIQITIPTNTCGYCQKQLYKSGKHIIEYTVSQQTESEILI